MSVTRRDTDDVVYTWFGGSQPPGSSPDSRELTLWTVACKRNGNSLRFVLGVLVSHCHVQSRVQQCWRICETNPCSKRRCTLLKRRCSVVYRRLASSYLESLTLVRRRSHWLSFGNELLMILCLALDPSKNSVRHWSRDLEGTTVDDILSLV